ncbi:MAG: hypothetical protein IKA36_01190 [Clostridia bacterium]|nr:hypothetical protein [Clostridia bacterium]
MTKRRSRCLFIIFAIILVVCLIASFVNFTYPFSVKGNYYSYSSFLSNMKLGEDLDSSVKIVYRTETGVDDYDKQRQATMHELREILKAEGYYDVNLAEYGDDGIALTVGNILNKDEENKVLDLFSNPANISFAMENDHTKAFANAKDVKSVTAKSGQSYAEDGVNIVNVNYVEIEFKDSVKDRIAKDTSSGGTMYIFFGETLFTSMSMSGGITEGVIQMQSSIFTDKVTTQTYANRIKTGTLSLSLTKLYSSTNTPSYGNGAGVLVGIALAVMFIVGTIYMIVKYKHLGWLSMFANLFYLVIGMFLIQSIPLVHINLGGILAIILSYMLLLDGTIAIFDGAKKNYQSDVKLHIALKSSQKDNLMRIIILNLVALVSGFVCLFMPAAAIQSFGWIMLVLSFVNVFITLVMLKLFINMYLPFNSENGKKCNFHKGGKNA